MQSDVTQSAEPRTRRLVPFTVFLVGLAMTASFYAALAAPSLRDTLAYRYFCGHPIEVWTTGLFFWALAALGAKAIRLVAERRMLAQPILQIPTGRALGVGELPRLIDALAKLPAAAQATWFVRRLRDSLLYVHQRGSADGLEDRLRVLADRDTDELDGSYELVRNITWAIPILGFLGTVVGITIAIGNITPEQLQESLSEVVGGLAVAFDTTALALALSMGVVLAKFLVERAEQGLLGQVNDTVEDLLLHRFEKRDPQTQVFLGVVEGVANVVMQSTRDAWREQGQLWTKAIEQVGESQVAALHSAAGQVVEQTGQILRQLAADQSYQFADVLKRLEALGQTSGAVVTGLGELSREWLAQVREMAHATAVEQTTQFSRFLTNVESSREAWEKHLADAASKMTAHQAAVKRQTELLAQLVADEGRLSKMQQSLNQNLSSLANMQALDEAIHSLSAAAHLLTARAGRMGAAPRLAVADESVEEAA